MLGASDEFFAEAANLLQPGRAVFVDGKFTERGKWMDGWESRRKRGAGHDWCVLALGAPGQVVGFDIDTQHFAGNHPPFASVDGIWAPEDADLAALGARDDWAPLLDQAALRPDAQNLFAAAPGGAVTHLRLNIFPDGGVARFRAFGRVHARWDRPAELDAGARAHVKPDLRDLAAVKNGGLALACSDAFFGPMNNLLLPGPPGGHGGRLGDAAPPRRRATTGSWSAWARGACRRSSRSTPRTSRGTSPTRCAVEAVDLPSVARITDLLESDAWRPLVVQSKLRADDRHFFPVGRPPRHARAAQHLSRRRRGAAARLGASRWLSRTPC